jgi:chromosome partitioning protein
MSSYVIVLGNEKGGTGKSTVSMHLTICLLNQGYSVGTIDVDARQGTFSRYIENRQIRQSNTGENLLLPYAHYPIFRSQENDQDTAQQKELDNFQNVMENLCSCDFIIIDTPGSDTNLSRIAHSYADTLITPLNDSFIDLDMLVRLDAQSLHILRPSTYAEMVWEQKKNRALQKKRAIDWIVLRNRLSSINSRNKEDMQRVLFSLSKRIGYRLVAGFGERVIFRELFLSGLTLLDLRQSNISMNVSHISARQELNELIQMINLPIPSQIPVKQAT